MKRNVKELSLLYKDKFGILPRFPATVEITEEEMAEQIGYCIKNNVTLSSFYRDLYEEDKIY